MKAQVVIGLGYGDEGKGSIVDYLCRQSSEPPVVVRFNGGGQAAHNVVTPEGRHHTFSQVGSGALAGASTFLSRFMVVSPLALVLELEALGWPEHWVDPQCLVITPYQRELNRILETDRGDDRHGSCGIGFGVAVEWSLREAIGMDIPSLRMGDLHNREKTGRIMKAHHYKLMGTGGDPDMWADMYCAAAKKLKIAGPQYLHTVTGKPLIFEGAQGVLLDQDLPPQFQPYTTWSKTTFDNAYVLLDEINGYRYPIERIGVHRAYSVRHGPGPFPTELDYGPIDPHNVENEWQGPLRVGRFDWENFQYALEYCGGVDKLAITCLDHSNVEPHIPMQIEKVVQKIDIRSWGPTAEEKKG